MLQLKSDGPQVEQGYTVAAVCLSGTDQHGEQMICRTLHNNSLYSTGSIAGFRTLIDRLIADLKLIPNLFLIL